MRCILLKTHKCKAKKLKVSTTVHQRYLTKTFTDMWKLRILHQKNENLKKYK